MAYKVNYYTLHKTNDGQIGNINMGESHFYTDVEIEKIPHLLDKNLPKNRIGVIQKIKDVGGNCLLD